MYSSSLIGCGQSYKAMYILYDVAQRLKKNELTASINQAEIFFNYGIVIEKGKIIDWGNTDIETWKNKLLNNIFNTK